MAALRGGNSPMGTWRAPEKLVGKELRAKWSPRTINSFLIRVRAVFDDLVAQGVLVRSPAALVKPLRVPRPALSTLDANQVAVLLAPQLTIRSLSRGV